MRRVFNKPFQGFRFKSRLYKSRVPGSRLKLQSCSKSLSHFSLVFQTFATSSPISSDQVFVRPDFRNPRRDLRPDNCDSCSDFPDSNSRRDCAIFVWIRMRCPLGATRNPRSEFLSRFLDSKSRCDFAVCAGIRMRCNFFQPTEQNYLQTFQTQTFGATMQSGS